MNYKYSTLALAIVALLTGCGAEDNKSIGHNDNLYPPTVKGDVTIPALHVGSTVQGAYQYFDPNPAARPEGNSAYSWRDANETELSTEQTLELTYDLLGDDVKFCVTPVAQGTNTEIGDEDCSTPREVLEPLGEKPVAENVILDNTTPQVGGTLSGSYSYTHPNGTIEGATSFVWYAGAVKLVGEENAILVLTPQNSEGKKIKFCVIPATQETTPVRGDEVCSLASATVVMAPGNVVPTATVDSVTGSAVEGAELTGEYTWNDVDNDVKAPSVYSWKRGADIIAGETAISYTTENADVGQTLSFCVVPFAATGVPEAGEIDCLAMENSIAPNSETPPTATPATIEVLNSGIFEVGDELLGKYVYGQAENVIEGTSTARWQIGANSTACTDAADNCSYILTTADLVKDVQFCVTPVTINKKEGAESCSATGVQPSGIQLDGVFEYDSQLTANVTGYGGYTNPRWMVNTGNQTGPLDDQATVGNASRTEQAQGLSYTIGVRDTATDAPREVTKIGKTDIVAAGTTGVIDDYDWFIGGSTSLLDARNFIGKSVEFCLDLNNETKCVSAADYSSVKGGLYYDENDNTKRAIEPIRQVISGNNVFHRPLTAAEVALKGTEFGDNLPTADLIKEMNGIKWAIYYNNVEVNAVEEKAIKVCRNLYAVGGDWHLPVGVYDSRYTVKAEFGNNPPNDKTDPSTLIKTLNEKLMTSYLDVDVLSSPVYGWPTGNSVSTGYKHAYTSASLIAATPAIYLTRMYAYVGGNTAVDKLYKGSYNLNLVSCIKNAAAQP